MRRLLEAGRRRARNYILNGGGAHRSRQLARNMETFVVTPEEGWLFCDPYWAIYFHDGRGAITKARGSLVWFRNRSADPRLRGGRTPNRARDLKKLNLSREEFAQKVRDGEIYVRNRVAGVEATPFFSNTGGMQGFLQEAASIVREEFRKYLLEELGGELEIAETTTLRLIA
jgi:hypothetical protein